MVGHEKGAPPFGGALGAISNYLGLKGLLERDGRDTFVGTGEGAATVRVGHGASEARDRVRKADGVVFVVVGGILAVGYAVVESQAEALNGGDFVSVVELVVLGAAASDAK